MSDAPVPPSAATRPPASRFSRLAGALLLALVLLGAAVVFIPAWVMQPYQAQSDFALSLAFFLRRWGTLLATATCIAAALTVYYRWRSTRLNGWQKAGYLLAVGLTLLAASLTRMDRFLQHFDPLYRPHYTNVNDTNFVGENDMVISVTFPGEPVAAAYPVRQIAHHHLVQDVVGGTPVIVTYCTLCHTGMVWKTVVDGRRLKFGIAGIKNQNTLLRDEETGSWWQQATGEAIRGPLRGRRLTRVFSEELTFAVWKRENPEGKVLKPVEAAAEAGRYFPANWEEWVATLPTVATPQTRGGGSAPRTLIVGVTVNGEAKAYPLSQVRKQGIINDTIGNVPVAVVRGTDQKSVRAFVRPRNTKGNAVPPPLTVKENPRDPQALRINAPVNLHGTARQWDFAGRAVAPPGLPLANLSPIPVITEYWFNWKTYHPNTGLHPGS